LAVAVVADRPRQSARAAAAEEASESWVGSPSTAAAAARSPAMAAGQVACSASAEAGERLDASRPARRVPPGQGASSAGLPRTAVLPVLSLRERVRDHWVATSLLRARRKRPDQNRPCRSSLSLFR
jgi:hypothetical protein